MERLKEDKGALSPSVQPLALRSIPPELMSIWSRGYCVSTIGLDENKIRKYVKYQEEREKREEYEQEEFSLFQGPILKAICYAGGLFTNKSKKILL